MQAPEILFEDNHLIAVNKKPGEISQGDKTGDAPLVEIIQLHLKDKYNKPGNVFTGLVHRIDRPVSGVLLFAKTSKANERMSKLIRERNFHKTYWAVVKNKPEETEGKLTHYLIKNQHINKSFAYKEEKRGSKLATLHYKLSASIQNYFLLEIHPETGRHHQIRVQLASMGCPIKGDVKYGFARTNNDGSIHLHARKLEFNHPVKNELVTIIANPPDDPVWKAFSEVMQK